MTTIFLPVCFFWIFKFMKWMELNLIYSCYTNDIKIPPTFSWWVLKNFSACDPRVPELLLPGRSWTLTGNCSRWLIHPLILLTKAMNGGVTRWSRTRTGVESGNCNIRKGTTFISLISKLPQQLLSILSKFAKGYWARASTVSWTSGLERHIQVLVFKSLEWGFESRSWHFFEQDGLL